MDIQAFPLQWPLTTPRTAAMNRKASSFKRLSWNQCIDDLKRELKLLGATREVISTNQPIRRDGLPYAQARNIEDPGVAVYFFLDSVSICLPCDRFRNLVENLRAVVLHVEAMRAMERYGVGTTKQAFAGYKALPQTAGEEPWQQVLGLRDDATIDQIRRAHIHLAQTEHPDMGGSAERMARINTARDRALSERSHA